MKNVTLRRLLVDNAAYLGIFSLLSALAYSIGYRMQIPYAYFQFLDPGHLENRFLESILHLHSQPPLLNFSLGVLLWLHRTTGLQAEIAALVIHLVLGGVQVLALGALSTALVSDRRIARIFMLVWLLNPMLYVSLFEYFYTFHELVFLSLLGIMVYQYLKSPTLQSYAAICALAVGLVLTRSLFHFAWALAVLLFLIIAQGQIVPRKLRLNLVVCLGVTTLVLVAWPLKNLAKFGFFGYSSWQGYNLSQGLPVDYEPVAQVFEQHWTSDVPQQYQAVPVLSEARKSDGRPNWNYYPIIPFSQELQSEALSTISHHPLLLFKKAAKNYRWSYSIYSARMPYEGTLDWKAPSTAAWYWLRTYEILAFQYFGGSSLEGPPTGFAFLFPIIILATLWQITKTWGRDPCRSKTIAVLLSTVLWVLVMVLFVDGVEGNRMRFSTEPYILLLACWVISNHTPECRRCT